MNTKFDNPKILLIGSDKQINNKDIIDNDKSYFNLLNMKIQKLNPQIIVINGKLKLELKDLIFK